MHRSDLLSWPLRLERRPLPSRLMAILSSPLAAFAMAIIVYAVTRLLGLDALVIFRVFFVDPFTSLYGVGELLLKATPLMLCALGLAAGYRANVWNIGAEGQFTMGAVAGSGVALFAAQALGRSALPVVLLAGVLGGMAWAAIPALLRAMFNASEIVVSLMLVYVSQLFLSFVVHGPWRDPGGQNFPQSRALADNALLAPLVEGTRVNAATLVALLLALLFWWFGSATAAGFRMRVSGLAPAAARYAGISERANIWLAMMLGGAMAGLAGICEVAGPIGVLQPVISPGYGFAAIIVAFVGRLHPLGIAFASLLLSALYLGGESAQIELHLPASISGLFQGALLLLLLAAELFIHYRLRLAHRNVA